MVENALLAVTEQTTPPAISNAGAWREALRPLWNPALGEALQTAPRLYRRDELDAELLPSGDRARQAAEVQIEEELAVLFWKRLMKRTPRLPSTDAECYEAAVAAASSLLRAIRHVPKPSRSLYVDALTAHVAMAQEEQELKAEWRVGGTGFDLALAVALRPIRRLQAGIVTAEICAALHDFHRGLWNANLTKPQAWLIRAVLTHTMAALPPDEMTAFWKNLQSSDVGLRAAMQLGLEALKSARAVPHLVRGLEQSRDHSTRTAIVDCLEQIGDPRALPALYRLRHETASTDWTLARHITRAMRVIERQTQHQQGRTLLRPAAGPAENVRTLLHPVENHPNRNDEPASLLRPAPDTPPPTPNQLSSK